MDAHTLLQLASILVLGVGAQWLAWRLRLPSILLLLLLGFIAGPVTGFLSPDRLLGPALMPGISLAVAIILFEGGLSLDLRALPDNSRVIPTLVSAGALVTWAVGSLGAIFILNLDPGLGILLGAILIVTGPTVITPMIRQIRPFGEVGTILRWEGIIIDPIGAMIAVLVYEVLLARGENALLVAIEVIAVTLVVGVGLGLLAALLLVEVMRRRWVPDHLENPAALMLMVAAFASSNQLQEESGLLAVTIMGIALATQKAVSIHHIVEFKENLQPLLLSVLFILLAARVEPEVVGRVSLGGGLLFLVVLVLVARPLSVLFSTFRTELDWRQRVFLGSIAPRGIVAAAVVAIFALELRHRGYGNADDLVPYTFLAIVGTITVYGLAAPLVARTLNLASPDPQGLLIAGAQKWVRQLCIVLKQEGFEILLVDTNTANIRAARKEGLRAQAGTILSVQLLEDLDLDGLGRFLAMTANDQVNSLAALQCREIFGRSGTYQLKPEAVRNGEAPSLHLGGRHLFHADLNEREIRRLIASGASFEVRQLTESEADDKILHPLFIIDPENEKLTPLTEGEPLEPAKGERIVALVG